MNPTPTAVISVLLANLKPSQHNPRETLDEARIAELAESLNQPHGQLTPLLVRPLWCVGAAHAAALAMASQVAGTIGGYEIVSGHCRHQAALKAKYGALDCIVRELSDPEAEEINLAEQIQRNDLTPVEEGKAFARQLDFKKEDGTPRHTAESLALTIGKKDRYVYSRLLLLKLSAIGQKALGAGTMPLSVARLVSRIPDEKARATALGDILKGNDGECMTVRQAEEHIATHFMRELKGAAFDQEDPGLCLMTTAGSPDHGRWSGKCSDCPHRTGNNKAVFGDVKRGDICTRPACFEAKEQAARHRVATTAKKEGKLVLTQVESELVYPPDMPLGVMAHNSALVPLDEVPEAHLLKAVVKNPPSWRELVTKCGKKDIEVPVYVAFDQKGKAVECAMREPLMAGAAKAGEPIFRDKNEPATPEDDEFKKRQREEAEAGKLRTHVAMAVMNQLLLSSGNMTVDVGFMKALLVIARENLGTEGAGFIVKWLGLKTDAGAHGTLDAIDMWIKGLNQGTLYAVPALLLIAEKMRWHGIQSPGVAELCAALTVDLKAIEKKATAEFGAKKTKLKPGKAAKPVAAPTQPPDRNYYAVLMASGIVIAYEWSAQGIADALKHPRVLKVLRCVDAFDKFAAEGRAKKLFAEGKGEDSWAGKQKAAKPEKPKAKKQGLAKGAKGAKKSTTKKRGEK